MPERQPASGRSQTHKGLVFSEQGEKRTLPHPFPSPRATSWGLGQRLGVGAGVQCCHHSLLFRFPDQSLKNIHFDAQWNFPSPAAEPGDHYSMAEGGSKSHKFALYLCDPTELTAHWVCVSPSEGRAGERNNRKRSTSPDYMHLRAGILVPTNPGDASVRDGTPILTSPLLAPLHIPQNLPHLGQETAQDPTWGSLEVK